MPRIKKNITKSNRELIEETYSYSKSIHNVVFITIGIVSVIVLEPFVVKIMDYFR